MSKSFLVVPIIFMYALLMLFAVLLGGIFKDWLVLEPRTIFRVTLFIAPIVIYFIAKKTELISIIDSIAPLIIFVCWLLMVLFGKSLVNSLIIELPIAMLLCLLYCLSLFFPKTVHSSTSSVLWLVFLCGVYIAIHFNVPQFGE